MSGCHKSKKKKTFLGNPLSVKLIRFSFFFRKCNFLSTFESLSSFPSWEFNLHFPLCPPPLSLRRIFLHPRDICHIKGFLQPRRNCCGRMWHLRRRRVGILALVGLRSLDLQCTTCAPSVRGRSFRWIWMRSCVWMRAYSPHCSRSLVSGVVGWAHCCRLETL